MGNNSCIICHEKIKIQDNSQLEIFLDDSRNYARCINNHYVHLEPCLKEWVIHSNKCPLCNISYAFEDFIKKARETVDDKEKEEDVISIASEIAYQLQDDEKKKNIKDKLDLAKYFVNNGQIVEALDILFNLLDSIDPKNVDALFFIGKIRYDNGRFGLAVSNFMKVVKIDYNYPLAFYYLGKSYENLGLKDKMIWALKRANENLKKLIKETDNDKVLLEYKEILNDIIRSQNKS